MALDHDYAGHYGHQDNNQHGHDQGNPRLLVMASSAVPRRFGMGFDL
jgi:hypothetical protein